MHQINLENIYEYKSSDELVDLINKYYESDELQKRHAQNARGLFEQSFNAEKVYKDFSEYLEKVTLDFKSE